MFSFKKGFKKVSKMFSRKTVAPAKIVPLKPAVAPVETPEEKLEKSIAKIKELVKEATAQYNACEEVTVAAELQAEAEKITNIFFVPDDYDIFLAGFEHLELNAAVGENFYFNLEVLCSHIASGNVLLYGDINNYAELGEWKVQHDIEDGGTWLSDYLYDFIDFVKIGQAVIGNYHNNCSFTSFGFFSMNNDLEV